MLFYEMNIAGCKRQLPICPVNDDLYIAGFVILGDPEICTATAKELLAKAPAYDYIITAETKGIPLVHEMARLKNNEKYLLARKKSKFYMTGVFEVEVQSITTAGMQTLCLDTLEAKLMKGKRILIVDDVISTGASLEALEALVNKAGGIVVGKMAILAEGKAQNRDDITYLEPLPLFNKNGAILEGSLFRPTNAKVVDI